MVGAVFGLSSDCTNGIYRTSSVAVWNDKKGDDDSMLDALQFHRLYTLSLQSQDEIVRLGDEFVICPRPPQVSHGES